MMNDDNNNDSSGIKKRPIDLVGDDGVDDDKDAVRLTSRLIDTLPVDILVAIFRFATATHRYHDVAPIVTLSRLSQCCRALRGVVERMPVETTTAATVFTNGDSSSAKTDRSASERWQRYHHRVRSYLAATTTVHHH